MGNIALSTPTVIVNNISMLIYPNSLVYDGGEGELVVRSGSGGGGMNLSVHTQNAETTIGKCSFDVFLTQDMDAKIALWKEQIGANSIQVVQRSNPGLAVTLSFDNMSLINAVERKAGADLVTSLEFAGDPMSIQ